MSDVQLHLGDCLAVLPTLAEGSADAVVYDPPYGLEFMGAKWDRLWDKRANTDYRRKGFGKGVLAAPNYQAGLPAQQWHQRWATAALRVLRPGGYLLAFGGTRTWHRLACALEDAGFEMRDTLMFMYATGFPKGKGCLKPAWEPVLLCRRPGPRVLPLGIDECRVPVGEGANGFRSGVYGGSPEHIYGNGAGLKAGKEYTKEEHPAGRWPANVAIDGSPEVLEAFAAFGTRPTSVGRLKRTKSIGYGGSESGPDGQGYGDTGTAARFFFCAKASRRERNAGLEGMPEQSVQQHGSITGDGSTFTAPDGTIHSRGKSGPSANPHPCVKPLALMRWLVALVCPPGGLCLDPFAGSGTTGVACVETGRRFVGVEQDAAYYEIAKKRIAAAQAPVAEAG